MRDRSEEWCSATEISISYINDKAIKVAEYRHELDSVYLSADLYAELHSQFGNMGVRGHIGGGRQTLSIVTAVGQLSVKLVPHHTNFCHIGSQQSFDGSEWKYISEEFEKIVFGDKDDA